jgi:hypothetical protein
VRRRPPCSGFVRGLQRTEAETKMGGIADTFQTRRVLVEEFGMMYWGCFACGGGEGIQGEAGQTALHALASTDSPTGSPRSSAKSANSARHENYQKLGSVLP